MWMISIPIQQMSSPKINIEPENVELQDDFPLPGVYSQVPRANLPTDFSKDVYPPLN